MTDKQPMQADGDDGAGKPDAVKASATGGESSGGAYPNPHSGNDKSKFDGGQSGKGYSGPDNPNATTKPK